MEFPTTRLRRNRSEKWLRNLCQEHQLLVGDLILPLFVHDKDQVHLPIPEMPEIKCYSVAELVLVIKEAKSLGINAVALFPVVDHALKSDGAEEAYNPDNLICRAIRKIKDEVDGIGIIADVALDPYTTHGHDGIMVQDQVKNDDTIAILCKQALVLAAAGCDVVAPSDMMDGRIKNIREALDNGNFEDVCILSYSVKYSSGFYSPFRFVVGSQNNKKKVDKSTYQVNPANLKESIREIEMDISEGADMVIIKPGMPYLDVVSIAAKKFNVPIFAYQVSGEYAMIKAAANNGWLDYNDIILESLLCFKRAGANAILTYAALEVAHMMRR